MPFNIDWADLWPNSRAELQDDHDMIVLSVQNNVVGVSGVRIMLIRAPHVSWWKGFGLVDAQGRQIGGIFGGQDGQAVTEHDYSMAEVGRAVRLELWKAKALGVHTHTYSIANLGPLAQGTVVELRWVQDQLGLRNARFVSALFTGVGSQDNQARTLTVAAGARFQLETRVNNVGSTIAFESGLDFRIGSQNPQDNTTWGTNRWELGGDIAPDAGRAVVLNLTAPSTPGTFALSLRMVQDGVAWFGDTFEYSATVGPSGNQAPPGKACILSALLFGLGAICPPASDVLDGARQLRSLLNRSAAGEQLVATYRNLGRSGELQSVITRDPKLLYRCLSLAGSLAGRAQTVSERDLPPALSHALPEFERILDDLHARSSAPTQQQLEHARHLMRAFVSA